MVLSCSEWNDFVMVSGRVLFKKHTNSPVIILSDIFTIGYNASETTGTGDVL